ncbi:MAG: SPOR domain-containing protein [Ignavibacteriales bacterium]|nr:SPOR domain-containing protein [Ignavibacteriales bacterium]
MNRTIKLTVLFVTLILNSTFSQNGDTTANSSPPPNVVQDSTAKLIPQIPVQRVQTRDLFTVVLYSSATEQDSRNRAKVLASQGYDVKLFLEPSVKKTKYKVTSGFFKKRLDAEFMKRTLIKKMKTKKLWVKQIDVAMSELILKSVKQNQKKDLQAYDGGYSRFALNNDALTALLNTGTSIIIYGLDGNSNGLKSLINEKIPFVHTILDHSGNVTSASLTTDFPVSFNQYKRFFFSFKAGANYSLSKVPVLISVPDKQHINKIENYLKSGKGLDMNQATKAASTLEKVQRQLVFKDFRIFLTPIDGTWFISGLEEIK